MPVSRHKWVEFPIPDTAIARVKAIALHNGHSHIQERGLVVEWRPSQPIYESEYDTDYALLPQNQPTEDALVPANYDPINPDELANLDDPFIVPAPAAAR